MAKRFTDTDKWKKPFIRALDAPYKLLWLYILDDCDMAGIWQKDFEVASIRIGEKVTEARALEIFGERIKVFGDKWFIVDFISFQYGELSENNRMHKAVSNTLLKNHIIPEGASKGLISPQGQIQGKGQGIIQGQGQKQGATKKEIYDSIFSDEQYVDGLKLAHGEKDLLQAFEECYMHHSQQPNQPQEFWQWRQKLNTWLTIKPGDRKNHKGISDLKMNEFDKL